MSTEQQRAEWARLDAARTPGEWGVKTDETTMYGTRFINPGVWGGSDGVTFICDCGTGKDVDADAAFIAAASAAVPALLADVDALAAELATVRAQVARFEEIERYYQDRNNVIAETGSKRNSWQQP